MKTALEKMMEGKGSAAPQIDGVAGERAPTMQEKMIMGMMKQVLPGLDFDAIAKIGTDAQEFAGRTEQKLDLILANQAGILAMLAQLTDAQSGVVSVEKMIAEGTVDPDLASRMNDHGRAG